MAKAGNIDIQLFLDNDRRTIQSIDPTITKIYSDSTYQYVCVATPDTALTDSDWLIYRVTLADGTIEYAMDANSHYGFHSPATSLAVVEALTFA